MIRTEEKNNSSILESIKEIKWTSILLCIGCFFISRTGMFETFYTLAICYVGAVYFDKDIRKWCTIISMLGLVSLGLISTVTIKYLFMIGLLMSIRLYMQITKKRFDVRNQAILTGIVIIVINLISQITEGITIYSGVIGVLEGIAGMGLVVVFSKSLAVIYKKRCTPLDEKEMISMAFLVSCFLSAKGDLFVNVPIFHSIYLKDILVIFFIMATTYLGGISSGLIMSLVLGAVLVATLSYMKVECIIIYMVGALMGAMFNPLGKIGMTIATGIGLVLGFAFFNQSTIDMQIIGAYIVAALLNICMPKRYFGIAGWFEDEDGKEEQYINRMQKFTAEKLLRFSKAFQNISHTFDRISSTEIKPSQKEINNLIEANGEKMCAQCSMNEFCWRAYIKDTYASSYEMLDVINKKGQITVGDIPPRFMKACINAESFAYGLTFQLDLYRQNEVWKRRFAELRKLMGGQFSAVADSVKVLEQTIEESLSFNKEDEGDIRALLYNRGIKPNELIVLENKNGHKEIHISIKYYIDGDFREELRNDIQEALGVKVDLKKYEVDQVNKIYSFVFVPKKQYNILCSSVMQAGSQISGDVYSSIELEDGNYLLALADGMGSGNRARNESTATIELFEALMESGFEEEVAIKMVNSILMLKSDEENYSTMDITLIDQYTGIAKFLKMGATTSFIVRDGQISTVTSESVPVGILSHIDLEVYRKQLKDGDLIIMVTDGILESHTSYLEKEDTFKHFIMEADSQNPEYLAKFLMQKSIDLLGTAEKDDMTITVARIWK